MKVSLTELILRTLQLISYLELLDDEHKFINYIIYLFKN